MTKTVKAWAVVDKRGEIVVVGGRFIVTGQSHYAYNMIDAGAGERVVRVTITVEDE